MKKVLKPKFEKLLGKIEKDIKKRNNFSKTITSTKELKQYLASL